MHAVSFPHAMPPTDAGFTGIDSLFPAQKPGPSASDVHPLVANYPIAEYSLALDPDRAVDVIIGETVGFVRHRASDTAFVGAHWTIGRAPADSRAKLDGSRLTPDLPGLYQVLCVLGGLWTRTLNVAAFHESTLDLTVYPPSMRHERRMRLRAVLHDRNVSPETIVACLERGPVDLPALVGFTGKKREAFNVEAFRK